MSFLSAAFVYNVFLSDKYLASYWDVYTKTRVVLSVKYSLKLSDPSENWYNRAIFPKILEYQI
jgi:hypothetical protein